MTDYCSLQNDAQQDIWKLNEIKIPLLAEQFRFLRRNFQYANRSYEH